MCSQDIIISINLLKMQILRPHSRHPELETWGEIINLCFTEPSRNSDAPHSLRTCDPEIIFLGPHWKLVNRYTQQLREPPFGSLTHVV